MKIISLITIVGILLLSTLRSFAEDPILVGVLEQPQSCSEKKEIRARVLFHKEGNKWNALGVSGSNKPSTDWEINSVRWTIAFDGKNLGTVQIEDPSTNTKFINDWYYLLPKLITNLSRFQVGAALLISAHSLSFQCRISKIQICGSHSSQGILTNRSCIRF